MKWYAISGSRTINDKVKKDVENTVTKIITSGNGIITGGALGVDYITIQEVLRKGNVKKQIRIYLPITIRNFCKHYHNRAKEGAISEEQAKLITEQLQKVNKISKESIIDKTKYKLANEESYYARNTSIVEKCDIFCAFQVNNSKGTQDAIDKAKSLSKKVIVKRYLI